MSSRTERRNRKASRAAKKELERLGSIPSFSARLMSLSESNFFWAGGVTFAILGLTARYSNLPRILAIVFVVTGWLIITISLFSHGLFQQKTITGAASFGVGIMIILGWWFLPSSDVSRPVVTVSVARLTSGPISSGSFPVADIEFKNEGNAIATEMTVAWSQGFLTDLGVQEMERGKWPSNGNVSDRQSVGNLGPNGRGLVKTKKLGYKDATTRDEMARGVYPFYVWGKPLYWDLDKKQQRWSTFCLRSQNNASIYFEFFGAGNAVSP